MRLLALASLALSLAAASVAWAKPPVLVELYTAQGCGACGAANSFAAELAERPGVLTLTFPVDYWDYLGWEDTFARPEFAARQRAYLGKLAVREAYTPQVIVDGRHEASGASQEKVEKLVREAARAPKNPPDMLISGRRVAVGSGPRPKGGADVWLIRYDPREREVAVRAGENRGKTIEHRNVVRQIVRLGAWRGRPVLFRAPAQAEEGLETVVVVQGAEGGRIIAVGQPEKK
jgi:hypothetical protein